MGDNAVPGNQTGYRAWALEKASNESAANLYETTGNNTGTEKNLVRGEATDNGEKNLEKDHSTKDSKFLFMVLLGVAVVVIAASATLATVCCLSRKRQEINAGTL